MTLPADGLVHRGAQARTLHRGIKAAVLTENERTEGFMPSLRAWRSSATQGGLSIDHTEGKLFRTLRTLGAHAHHQLLSLSDMKVAAEISSTSSSAAGYSADGHTHQYPEDDLRALQQVLRGWILQMAFGADDFRNLQHLDGGDVQTLQF